MIAEKRKQELIDLLKKQGLNMNALDIAFDNNQGIISPIVKGYFVSGEQKRFINLIERLSDIKENEFLYVLSIVEYAKGMPLYVCSSGVAEDSIFCTIKNFVNFETFVERNFQVVYRGLYGEEDIQPEKILKWRKEAQIIYEKGLNAIDAFFVELDGMLPVYLSGRDWSREDFDKFSGKNNKVIKNVGL